MFPVDVAMVVVREWYTDPTLRTKESPAEL
jgi:hypothetical protein